MTHGAQLSTRRVFSGRVINLDVDRVRYPDGSEGDLDIVRHPGASAIVPFLSDPAGENPQVLMIKQYRYATDGYLFEIPAGRLESGEKPEDCARRELREETGCVAGSMRFMTSMWTTPGFTDERIHLFLGSDLTQGETRREADEFMTVQPVFLSEALKMIERGEIQDAKTALGLLYAAGFLAGT